MFPDVKGRRHKRKLYALVSPGSSFQIRKEVLSKPDIVGKTLSVWVPAADDVNMLMRLSR